MNLSANIKYRQKGFALVLAMMIAALVAAIAVEVSWRFDISISRSGNRWHGMQAKAYLGGVEDIATSYLLEDEKENQYDSLDDIWAQQAPPLPTDEGWVQGRIEDAHGRFNINLLGTALNTPKNNKTLTTAQKYSASQRRFIRLLQTVDIDNDPENETYLDQAQAINVTEAVLDWMDSDQNVTGFGGAEADYYSQLEPSFTIANSTFVSVSELRIIKGVTAELYKGLLPYIIALPEDAKLNVNTMSVNVARTINTKDNLEPLDLEEAQALVEEQGYEQLEDFKTDINLEDLMGGDVNKNLDESGLVVVSEFFILYAETMVGEHIRRSRSLLHRSDGDVKVMRRTDANF